MTVMTALTADIALVRLLTDNRYLTDDQRRSIDGVLAAAERAAVPRKLWLWKNFVDGKPEYWAFDNPFPIYMDNGDPQTFGQPCGYALFKRSRRGRDDVSDEQVLADIRRAAESGIGPCVGPADRSNHCGRCGSPPGQPCRNRPPLAAAAPADDLVERLRRSSKANAGTGVGMFADEVLAALAALRAENGRLRDNLASKTAERDVALGALAEQEERAERAESQLAAAQAVLAAAHDALTEIALAGMSLPMVCGDDEETKNRFHARRAWEFIGIAARAKTEIDAARAAAGGGK